MNFRFSPRTRECLLAAALVTLPLAVEADDHTPRKVRQAPENLSGEEARTVALYQEVLPTVVSVTTSKRVLHQGLQQHQSVVGSGVLISPDCHVLTAAHVVDGADTISVTTYDGTVHEAELVFSELGADIALVRLNPPELSLKHARLGDSDRLAVGQTTYVVGNPYGLENSFSTGHVSGFREGRLLYDGTIPAELIQTDAAINTGNSGGPVFNSAGEVIGIASRIISVSGGSQGLGFIVAINTAKALLALEDRAWMGIEAIFLTRDDLASLMNLDLGGGMLIQRVASGSPAEKSGLRGGSIPAQIGGRDTLLGGDLIIEIGAQEVCHSACLVEAKSRLRGMRTVPIAFLRGGKRMETVVDVSVTRRSFLQ